MPRFRLKLFLPSLQLLYCLFFLFNAPVAHALIAEAHEIEQQLAKSAALGLSKNAQGDLQRFYSTRQYQPVWVTKNPHSPSLDAAVAFIASADNEGLDSRDYQLHPIQQLQQQAGQSLAAASELEVEVLLQRVADLTEQLAIEVANTPERPKYVQVAGTANIMSDGARPYFGSIPDYGSDQPGFRLSGVSPGGPADKGGLKAGDRIIQMGMHKVENIQDFDTVLRKFSANDTIDVTVQRGMEKLVLKVTLGKPRG